MEATAVSVAKFVLDGALGYAKSALAEKVALQLRVQRDHIFIVNELEMMQAFLMTAHNEGDDKSEMVNVWVKQVRDVAYDVEDSLQDFAVRVENKQAWSRIYRSLLYRHHVAKQMKELKANVHRVWERSERYKMDIKRSVSKSSSSRAMDEAKRYKKKGDLVQLINNTENDLRVISVWGTSPDLGQTSLIRAVYESPDTKNKFPCRAWVGVMHPFNTKDFIQSLVEQFRGVNVLLETENTAQELTQEFNGYLNHSRYLIVINNLSSIEDWDRVIKWFPNNKTGSRIIVSTTHVEVATLCAGQETIASELKQLSADQIIYAFQNKQGSQDLTNLTEIGSSSNRASTNTDYRSTMLTGEILEDQFQGADENMVIGRSLSRRMMSYALEESHVVGRVNEKCHIIRLILSQATRGGLQVISVWGMGGIGKTTLIKHIYQKISHTFERRACLTIMRPFNVQELLLRLLKQVNKESYENDAVSRFMGRTENTLLSMPIEGLIEELTGILQIRRCFIILDDVSSTAEWDMILPIFSQINNTSRIIVTTREENIAQHCSVTQENIYNLKGLDDSDARDLFIKKVFEKENVNFGMEYPELVEQANLILKKCSGLPLAIVAVGGFLSNQPRTSLEWSKLNEHISADLETNPKLGIIRSILMTSYDRLPYHLKSCFLYMSIFPEDHRIGRRRLVHRWTAEGYSRELRGKSAEEIADDYFMELIRRSMILPSQRSTHSTKGIDSCQVHGLIREIGISKSMEENLVFRIDERCVSKNLGIIRHLAISNWKGNKMEFERMVDMSRVRSLTVFGEWKNFYISDNMSMLRVLDLEDTTGLQGYHLKHIGKLLHLKYLSLRGCEDITELPGSFGNLMQLETLDVRGSGIIKLPECIINLQKLKNISAGRKPVDENVSIEDTTEDAPQPDKYGVLVPKGMSKLKDVRTLGVVNIARDMDFIKDVEQLTQLRKLGVTGINSENGGEFCRAIRGMGRLECLSIRSEGMPGLRGCLDNILPESPLAQSRQLEAMPGLHGCLDDILPESPLAQSRQSEAMPGLRGLQSLKLYGNLGSLPIWVPSLHNLVKLKLRNTFLRDYENDMRIIGKLPNLAFLHLMWMSFSDQQVSLHFEERTFTSLVVLEVCSLKSIKFDETAVRKLEMLKFWHADIEGMEFAGLPSLLSLKEVVLQGFYEPKELDKLKSELAKNSNRPLLKTV